MLVFEFFKYNIILLLIYHLSIYYQISVFVTDKYLCT